MWSRRPRARSVTQEPFNSHGAITEDAQTIDPGGIEGEPVGSITVGSVKAFKHGDPVHDFDPNGHVFSREI